MSRPVPMPAALLALDQDDRLISWAPDFCSETADRILQLLNDLGIELADTELAHASDWA
jgi:ribosome assembly protein YihI (activator of Der GTPase)